MMSKDQASIVSQVYRRFLDSEQERIWDDLDNSLQQLEWLNDLELQKEAESLFVVHKTGNARCRLNHPAERCFVPTIIDAVKAILDLQKESKELHVRNKYILQYYLALTHTGFIVLEKT